MKRLILTSILALTTALPTAAFAHHDHGDDPIQDPIQGIDFIIQSAPDGKLLGPTQFDRSAIELPYDADPKALTDRLNELLARTFKAHEMRSPAALGPNTLMRYVTMLSEEIADGDGALARLAFASADGRDEIVVVMVVRDVMGDVESEGDIAYNLMRNGDLDTTFKSAPRLVTGRDAGFGWQLVSFEDIEGDADEAKPRENAEVTERARIISRRSDELISDTAPKNEF